LHRREESQSALQNHDVAFTCLFCGYPPRVAGLSSHSHPLIAVSRLRHTISRFSESRHACRLPMNRTAISEDTQVTRTLPSTIPGADASLNAFAEIRKFTQQDVERGIFDPLTLVETLTVEWDRSNGKRSMLVKERGYLPQELVSLLGQARFKVDNIWGGTAGRWGRRALDLDRSRLWSSQRSAALFLYSAGHRSSQRQIRLGHISESEQ